MPNKNDTLTCPYCGAESGKVTVEAPATVEISQRVEAEIDISTDLVEKEYGGVKHESKYRNYARYLVDPRVGELNEVLDNNLDVHTFELDAVDNHGKPDILAYCWECQADVTDKFLELLEARIPREPNVVAETH